MSKLKLATYSVEDQASIKRLMPFLIEVQIGSGAVSENDTAIKELLPEAFADVCAVMDKLNLDLGQFAQADADTLKRIKVLTLRLLAGHAEASRGRIDRASLMAWLAQAYRDARQVSNAVDEYLCG